MLAMTTDFHGTSRKSADIKSALTRIVRAGFSHVHWGHEGGSYYLYSTHEMLQIKEWCDELGLKVKGIHASAGEKSGNLKDYASSNEYNRLAGVELIKNRVDLAHILNAEAIILHSHLYWLWIKTEQAAREREEEINAHLTCAAKSFDELEGYCKTRHIKICIENCGTPALFLRIFDTYFERYDRDFMGLCFDTGHSYIDCRENCLEYAQRYNDRIFMIHAHDNHGPDFRPTNRDEHLIPFDGTFDWEAFAPLLARSPYTFPILLECMNDQNEDDTVWLERAFNAGSRITAMVEKYR